MKIEIESNNFGEKSYCYLCGSVFFPKDAIARAYRSSGEYLSDVCPHCLSAGATSARQRMQQRANLLRAMADELEKLARGEIESPTLEQLNIMNQVVRTLR
jgi:hypothetical protein